MNKRINKTRTILLLLSDKEMNLTFSSKKHQLKINSVNPKELTYKYIGSLTISFTNPIDTNSSINNNNNSSVNLLIRRKSMTTSLISKAKHEKSMMFTRKVSVSRMKLQFNFKPQKEEDFITESSKYKKYEANYLNRFTTLLTWRIVFFRKLTLWKRMKKRTKRILKEGSIAKRMIVILRRIERRRFRY